MSNDAAQDYLESGGATVHPLDAANDSTSGTASTATSRDPAQAYLESGGKTEHPLSKDTPKVEPSKEPSWWDHVVSGAKADAALASGVPAGLAGGMTYLGGLIRHGGDTEQAAKERDTVQNALTYHPDDTEAQGVVKAVGNKAAYLGEKGGDIAGDYVMDKTNSPLLAAGVKTAYNVPQYLVGGETVGAAGKAGLTAARGGVDLLRGTRAATESADAAVGATAATPKPELFKADTKAAPKAETAKAPPTTADGSQQATTNTTMRAERAKVLQSVGFDQARESALTNDGPAGMSEYQTSRDPTTPQGLEAKKVFDNERATLNTHGESIVDDTGAAHPGLDGASLDAKGETILKPFEQMGDYFDAKRKAAYDAADERMGGQPVKLGGFKEALEDASNTTNQDSVGLRDGLRAYVKKLGIAGDDGSIAGTGTQAETVRKYINGNWSPANSKFAGTLKDALDDDVTKAAGSDVYKDARATVKLQKDTLENPTGIGSMLDSSGPNGINRKVAVGKVADHIASLPTAQLKHITDTLDKAPPEIQEAAQAAKAEIQGHMASRLMEAGNRTSDAWGHKAVNQFMDANSAKLPVVFGKDNPALTKMNNLRAAGNILRVDRSYPGAAIQGNILRSKLIPGLVGGTTMAVGEGVGHWLTGVHGVGGTVGGMAGGAIGRKMAQSAGTKAVRRRMTDLDDVR